MSSDPRKHRKHHLSAELREKIRHAAHLPALSLWMRIIVFVVGWTLVLIGIAGLALPGIQGILTIVIGVSVLSLASETAYRMLKKTVHPWPKLSEKIDHLRHKVHDKLHRKDRN